jgi:DNA-binding XRE family transcriptional regulator
MEISAMAWQKRFTLEQRRDLAQNFRNFRMDHLLTQKDLAELLAVSRQTVCNLEWVKHEPRPSTYLRFVGLRGQYRSRAEEPVR